MLFRDRLEIWNPGILPLGLTIQDLEGPHKSQPHNPLIAEPMFLKGYIEKAGTGTEDIITKCVNHGLRKPEYHQGTDFRVVIWRKDVAQKNEEVVQKAPQVSQKNEQVSQKIERLSQKAMILSQKLSQKTIESIFFAINNDAYISIRSIADFCGCSARTIIRYVNLLTENGYLTHHGPDKGGFRTINWDKD